MNAIRNIGIVGLGKMGAPMAKHLLAKGYNVAAYDPLDAARRNALALGVSVLDSPREVARASELVIVVVGFDHEVETVVCGSNGLMEAARPGLVVAIGECGLDFNRNYSPHPDQEKGFIAQLELGLALGKALFLHSRDAHPRFAEILKSFKIQKAVAHCFTGEKDELHAYLDLGLYIGITGWICDERRGTHLLQLVRDIPADRLLLETDSPYLTPRDMQPQPKARRNEPAFLPHILRTVARALGKSPDVVAAETTRNAQTLFGIAG
jgi:TatD family hydrolase